VALAARAHAPMRARAVGADGIASGDFVRRETVGLHARKKKKSQARRTMPFRLCPFDCKPVDRSDGGTAAHQQCKVKGRTRCAAAALAACCMAACCVLLTLHNDNGPNTWLRT
jgi:hypothetical protein